MSEEILNKHIILGFVYEKNTRKIPPKSIKMKISKNWASLYLKFVQSGPGAKISWNCMYMKSINEVAMTFILTFINSNSEIQENKKNKCFFSQLQCFLLETIVSRFIVEPVNHRISSNTGKEITSIRIRNYEHILSKCDLKNNKA